MRRSDLVQHKEREKGVSTRTSQIIFGERQHLLRVLDSLEGTELPIARMQQERRILEELIHARTRDLNQINTAWDEKIGLVLSADAKPEMLEKLVKQAPREDFYLLRLISEHPRANAKTLNKLAKHPYGAIRENVAEETTIKLACLATNRSESATNAVFLVRQVQAARRCATNAEENIARLAEFGRTRRPLFLYRMHRTKFGWAI